MKLTQKIKELYSEINWKLTSALVSIPVISEIVIDDLMCSHKSSFDDHGDYLQTCFETLIMLGFGVYISHKNAKRKKAEEAKVKSELRFKEFTDMLPEAIFEINKELNLTYANKKALELFEYSKHEFENETISCLDLVVSKDREKVIKRFMRRFKGEIISKTEYNMVTKTGTIFPSYFHANSILEDEKIVGLRGIIVDITKQKENETILRNSEDRLKKAQTIAKTGSWEYNLDTEKIWGSQEAFKIYGITHNSSFLPLEKVEECIHDKNRVNKALMDLIMYDKPYDLEFTINRNNNNELKHLYSVAEKVFDNDGNFIKITGVIQDITKQKKIEEEKSTLEAQLLRFEKMKTIGVLAGGVAHDLNNVLSGIVGYPDLLLMDLPDDSPMRKSIEAIQQSGLKAAAIVQDLLTLARRGVIVNEVVNLNDIIFDYLKSPEYEMMKSYAPDVVIETNLKKDLLNILGSPVHLSKTVMNLVSNATESIIGKGKVQISSKQQYIDKPIKGYDDIKEGDYAILNVTDNGIGISDEHINKIFEPFYSKKVMGRSGTGLGMAVVWGSVKDHNGYIDVKTVENEGSTFSLYFPVTRGAVSKKIETKTIENYLGNGESILVIDDVEEQRRIATSMLEKLNYNVTNVPSGEEAIKYLKTNQADLLLLDMIMDPGIDGLETYRRIKKIIPEQKAVIASGFSENNRVKKTINLGAGQYIKKPYTFEVIGNAVKTELEKKNK